MKKNVLNKFKFSMIVFILLIILLPSILKITYCAYLQDEGPDTCSSKWYFTYYSDGNGGLARTNPNTNQNFKQSDWKVNPTYGWHEWEYKGTSYVVVAAATLEGLDWIESQKRKGDYRYPFLSKQGDIHYFHYGSAENDWTFSTFGFHFVNNNDNTQYYGVVLDTCEMSMDPDNPAWSTSAGDNYGAKPANTQWLDVHVPLGYPETSKYAKFNGKEIEVTTDGKYTGKNSVGKKKWFEGIITGIINFADTLQISIESANNLYKQTEDLTLTLSKKEINKNELLKKEINIRKSGYKIKNSKMAKEVTISNNTENKNGETEIVYSENTPIPIVKTDLYSASLNKVELLDINFLDINNSNPNKIWKVIRSVVSAVSHVVMYISAAAIISMIIVRGILLILSIGGNDPEGAARSKTIMDKIVQSICMLAFIYIFMSLMIGLNNQVVNLLGGNNDSVYLIRVNVDEVYSFNTNLIGYLKYLTLNNNATINVGNALMYLLAVMINFLWFVYMCARMVMMGLLIILAPLTAVTNLANIKFKVGTKIINAIHFKNWVTVFLRWLWIPVIFGVIPYRLVLLIL